MTDPRDLFVVVFLSEFAKGVAHDVWRWLLSNVNLIVIVGAYRAWSMHEHRKTAALLEKERIELARLVAETTRSASATNTAQNATILRELAENTAISVKAADGAVRAFEEANSVNQKILEIGTAQRTLEDRQDRTDDRT